MFYGIGLEKDNVRKLGLCDIKGGLDMKPTETKREYIRLRAEGKSYSSICEQLHISKGTCSKWEKAFREDILTHQKERLQEISQLYEMSKESEIRRIGSILQRIEQAMEKIKIEDIEPAKLLELNLKYLQAYKELRMELLEHDDDREGKETTIDPLSESLKNLAKEMEAAG